MTSSTFGELMAKAEASGGTFEILEAGRYTAKIIESEYKQSSTGKPQIKTRWEVTTGPKAGYRGLWLYFTLTVDNPNALGVFYRQMSSLGITSEFLSSLSNTDPETALKHISSALEGRSAYVDVKIDTEYNNNKITRVNPLPPEFAQTAAASADPFAAAAAPPLAQAVPSSPPTPTAPAEPTLPAPPF